MRHTRLCVVALALAAMIPIAHAADEATLAPKAVDVTAEKLQDLMRTVQAQSAEIAELKGAEATREAKVHDAEVKAQEQKAFTFTKMVNDGGVSAEMQTKVNKCKDSLPHPGLTEDGSNLRAEYENAKFLHACTLDKAHEIRGEAASTDKMALQMFATDVTQKPIDEAGKDVEVKKNNMDWAAMGWGVGVGVSFGKKTVSTAEISGTSGLVHVTEVRQNEPRVLLEVHTYPWTHKWGNNLYGGGFFVAAASGDNKVLDGVGGGLMFGIKSGAGTTTNGLSIGIGAILDSKVKDLGPGFTDGAAPPAGETVVRYSAKSRASGIIMASTTF